MVQLVSERPGAPTSAAVQRIGSSAIRDLLAITERPDVISLAGGKPTPDAFPVEALRAATERVLTASPAAALQYSATEGYRPLRERVAGDQGVPVDQVTITTGSQQALDLTARALLDAGDVVAMADPGYIGAIQAFRLTGATLVGVPSDGDGLDVEALAQRLAAGLRPRLVYVVPDLGNPTAATLSAARRGALAELAETYGFHIVSDDPYGALRWRGTPPPPLRTYTDRTITLGTLSKTLAPGLRVAHATAPEEITRSLVLIKQATDLHTPTLTQHLAHALLEDERFLSAHLTRLPSLYRARADALSAALGRNVPQLTFDAPDGGMFLWATLQDGRPTKPLLAEALRQGVAYVPGDAFAVEPGAHRPQMRLSFATATEPQLEEATRRLARALA